MVNYTCKLFLGMLGLGGKDALTGVGDNGHAPPQVEPTRPIGAVAPAEPRLKADTFRYKEPPYTEPCENAAAMRGYTYIPEDQWPTTSGGETPVGRHARSWKGHC